MKLNQVLAIETGKKTTLHRQISDLHHATEKSHLLTGYHKVFTPKNEEGETFPDESQHVQYRVREVIEQVVEHMSDLMDLTATKDWANCNARSDVLVNGEPLLEKVPVTYLLFLEKELQKLQIFVSKMVELDPAEKWSLDPNSGLFRSEPVKKAKTRKLEQPIVLYDATPEHPAQTHLISKDVTIGHWVETKFSAAIPRQEKKQILDRIQVLYDAVKVAREAANSTEVEEKKVGEKVLNFLFRSSQ